MKTGEKPVRHVFISDFHAGYLAKYQEKKNLHLEKRSSKIIYASTVAILSFAVGLFAGKTFAPISTTNAVSSDEINIDTSAKPENSIKTARATLEKVTEQKISENANIPRPSYNLEIPSVGIFTNITTTYVNENNDIVVPPSGIAVLNSYKGRYFNLLVGHRSGILKNIGGISYGDIISYFGNTYRVSSIYQQTINDVNMYSLTSNSPALKLITCAGPNNSERLIVEAIPV